MEKELVQKHGCTWKEAHKVLAQLKKELEVEGETQEERNILLDAAHSKVRDGSPLQQRAQRRQVLPGRLFPPSWQIGDAADSIDTYHKQLRIQRAQLSRVEQTLYPTPYRIPRELMFVVDHRRDRLPGRDNHDAAGGNGRGRICTEAEFKRIREIAHGLRGREKLRWKADFLTGSPMLGPKIMPIKDIGPIAKTLVEEFPRLDITIQPVRLFFDDLTVYRITVRPPPGVSEMDETDADSGSERESNYC